MGIGAMATVMLKLPMTSTLLATLLLASDGITVVPLVIVAVVVAYVASAWMPAGPTPAAETTPGGATPATESTPGAAAPGGGAVSTSGA